MLETTYRKRLPTPMRHFCCAFWCSWWLLLFVASDPASADVREFETDLLIAGGTESGWAAAIQAARLGVPSITIDHDGQWLGGQFMEQALACVDENKGVGKVGWGVDWHPMKRSFHRSGLFKELMDRIEAFNTEKYGSPMPGRPFHGPSTFRPAEAEAIFREMLQPYLDSGQVRFITNRYPVRADVEQKDRRPQLTGLWFAPLDDEPADLHVRARLTIDASDWGEAIQVSGAAFECGPDSRTRQLSVYTVRRIVDGYTSKDGKTSILLNYMNGQDCPLERLPQHVVDGLEATELGASEKNIVLMTRQQRQLVFDDAKRQSLSVLYHLQNFVHDRAPDETNSFRRFHLSDEFGTPDRLPPKSYIRQSLRLKAMYMMREQDGRNTDGTSKQMARERFAQVMWLVDSSSEP